MGDHADDIDCREYGCANRLFGHERYFYTMVKRSNGDTERHRFNTPNSALAAQERYRKEIDVLKAWVVQGNNRMIYNGETK